jgi:NADP-dependent 3-hydroxy acid dehydrogenase YdfG
MEVDLSTKAGALDLYQFIKDKGVEVEVLLANAGRGLGMGFLDQDLDEALYVVDTNVTGTVALIHAVGSDMRSRGSGRILITGSIAGFIPGSFQAVYNGTKSFLNSFSFALRNELDDSGVTVTCLMPGPTETRFFERADMRRLCRRADHEHKNCPQPADGWNDLGYFVGVTRGNRVRSSQCPGGEPRPAGHINNRLRQHFIDQPQDKWEAKIQPHTSPQHRQAEL